MSNCYGIISPARLEANRRNALKSTGPKTRAGKRRAALNSRHRKLCAPGLERDLRARGEDPREFCRLHRDLIAIFHPAEAAGIAAVELLARTWWKKARRLREWVAAGRPPTEDLDGQIEKLLVFLVRVQRKRHEPWRRRLSAVVGWPLGPPADVRQRIERRLFVFGASKATRKYAFHPCPLDEFEAVFGRLLGSDAKAAVPQPAETEAR